MKVEVNVDEAQSQLSRLLEQAMAGEEVIIMRSGRQLVRLTPIASAPGDVTTPVPGDTPADSEK